MKKTGSFWQSLEIYTWKVVERSPLPWSWIGIGTVVLILLASLLNRQNSVVSVGNMREVIVKAAERGDYGLARKLLDHYTSEPLDHLVLGVQSELEDKVYPERVVERRTLELETKLGEYPGNRQIYLMLSELYRQLENPTKESEYREKARVLDPNNLEYR